MSERFRFIGEIPTTVLAVSPEMQVSDNQIAIKFNGKTVLSIYSDGSISTYKNDCDSEFLAYINRRDLGDD